MSDRDSLLDSAALVRAAAEGDRIGAEVVLNNCDQAAVIRILAAWCGGWLRGAERLADRPGWFHAELRSWCEQDLGNEDHPWPVP